MKKLIAVLIVLAFLVPVTASAKGAGSYGEKGSTNGAPWSQTGPDK